MKSTIIILLLGFMFSSAIGQDMSPCGTDMGRSEWLKNFQAGNVHVNRTNGDWLIVPIYVHITGEDNGTGYTSTQLVGEAIKIMNEAFAQAEMQFFLVTDYHFIDNSEYHNHTEFSSGRRMMQNNNVSNVFNIYICADAAGNCGYYSPGQDAIVINDNCLDETNQTLAHEMGHFLSLPHPFSGWEGTDYDDSQPTPEFIYNAEVEKTDRSNCTTAGDGFCDTEADYLSFRWSCGGNGESAVTQFDPDGIPFNSQGNIIMSYSTGSCRDKFAADQIDAMFANIMDLRSSVLNHSREFQELTRCGRVKQYEPAQLEEVHFDDVTLRWENIPGIDYYTLRVSKNINFTDLIVETDLSDSFYILPTLELGRTYFWQVSGFAAQSPCIEISSKRWLRTADLSATIDLENGGEITTYLHDNNLIINTNEIQVGEAAIYLYDLSGRQVFSHRVLQQTSTNSYPIPNLSVGVYLVRIVSPEFEITTKVIK